VGLEEGLLGLALEGQAKRGARVTEAHDKAVDAPLFAADDRLGLEPVDLGLLGREVDLGDEGGAREAELAAAPSHPLADGRLGHLRAVLGDEALPDAPGGVALLGGASRSATSHSSMSARWGPSAGAGRPLGRPRSGGRGEASAWRTVRR